MASHWRVRELRCPIVSMVAPLRTRHDEERRSPVILRITAQDPRSREKKDIEVVASPDDSVGALLSSLPLDLGGRRCFVGATPLDPGEKLASSPLLPGTALSVGGPGPDYHLVRGAAAGTAHVLAGPDAGFGVALRPGRHTLGRIPGSAVRLNDEGVSRTHAAIEAHPGGAAVISDAGSSNGTLVNGTLITAPATLPSGSLIQVGASLLRWIAASPTPLRVAQTADGHLEFDRVFAPVPAIPQAEIDLPAQQAPGRGAATMVLSVIGGLASGIILAAAMRQWDLLLVSALGPLAPFGVYAVEGRQRKQRKATLARAKEDATAQIAALAAQEDQARRLLAPGQAEIVAMATGMRPDLWPRDGRSPHGLLLRVGVADRPPSVQVHGQPWDGFQMPVLAGVPVTVDLRETGVLGVIGSGERARGLLRWLLVQLATLRSPDDLRLVLLTPDSGTHMGWARWLPHLDPGNAAPVPCWIGNTEASRAARIKELGQLIKDRMAAASDRGEPAARSGGEVVVVLDGALALRKLTGIRDILRLGPEAGVYVLCADTQGMTECRGLCELTADGIRLIRSPNEPVVTASPETMEPVLAEQVARALAPMRDRMSGTDVQAAIPYPVRLLDRLGLGTPTAEDVLGLWRRKRRGPSTRIVLGADAAGQVTVDLAGQGPHTMLGGATGAGKSILLQTLVTALLLANQPDELNLVLVDFKGGSAFLPFQHCPHVTALIRSTGETAADSFTEADADRMLASVRAEVRRRESVLARHGGEIDHYWQARAAQPGLPPLPRLVMIFDEFARVLDTSPNFLKELVNVAGKGRSLGMHLVLATQSLQGKLSPELKNNISLRISLRQNEPADSVEVLGAPDAATIPGTLRGRGMILCTTDESRTPRVFQSGYLGDPPPGSVSQLSVRVLGWADLGAERPAPVTSGGGDATDQELAIAAVVEAARGAGMAAPFRALLPPLPASLPLEQLTGYQTSPPPGMAIPFGLTDVPDEQAQPPCFLDLAATGRLMVAGGPQSGRTTFARALITSLATRFSPGQAHFYVVGAPARRAGGVREPAALRRSLLPRPARPHPPPSRVAGAGDPAPRERSLRLRQPEGPVHRGHRRRMGAVREPRRPHARRRQPGAGPARRHRRRAAARRARHPHGRAGPAGREGPGAVQPAAAAPVPERGNPPAPAAQRDGQPAAHPRPGHRRRDRPPSPGLPARHDRRGAGSQRRGPARRYLPRSAALPAAARQD